MQEKFVSFLHLFGRERLPLKLLLLAHDWARKVFFPGLAECGGVIVVKIKIAATFSLP